MILINQVEQKYEAKEEVNTQRPLGCPLLHVLSHNFALIEQHLAFSHVLVQAGCSFVCCLWDVGCAKA